MAAGVGVQVVILDDDNRVLLIQREDFEVWSLPGGEVERGESLAQAAIREAHEETGLTVSLLRLVGIYSMPDWPSLDNHQTVFAARSMGGTLTPQAAETLDVCFFPANALPDDLIWWQRRRIADAVAGAVGVCVSQNARWPNDDIRSRADLYRQRDESGMSRSAFFFHHVGRDGESIPELDNEAAG